MAIKLKIRSKIPVLYLVQIDELFGPVQNNLIWSKTISTDPKQFGRVQNCFGSVEGQGKRFFAQYLL